MAGIKQVVEFSNEDIKNILIDKAKELVSEAGGKQLQGKSSCDFNVTNLDSKTVVGAMVFFERAGK